MSETIVRFAPSPTGRLHVGNARTAVLNYLMARKAGGKFLLRIDDTDFERSTKEYEQGILTDVAWMGMEHDLFARQSERAEEHRAAAEKLRNAGLIYPCYETPEELERRRKIQLASGRPPVYDRAALRLTDEQVKAFEAEGRKAHWRFKLSHKKICFRDLIRGEVEIDTANLSDPVLIRGDGRFLYTLPSVVDDIEYKISHIIRGEDHVTNTAVQIEIFEALGAKPPVFAHHPLLIGAGGEALSKRLGSLSLGMLRDDEIEPMALVSYLAKTGSSDAIKPYESWDEIVKGFALSKIGRAPAHFDPAELEKLNAKYFHDLPFAAVADRLLALQISGGESFWDAARANIVHFSDVKEIAAMVAGPVTPVIENADLCQTSARLLPPEPWDDTTWKAWTKAVAAETGAKGKELFHPIRLALTGKASGPELKKLLPLIGRAKSEARLKGQPA